MTVNCSSYFLRNLLNMFARKIDFRHVADMSFERLARELLKRSRLMSALRIL
jgi:hypothetical protein